MPTIKRFEQQVAPVTRTRRIARSGTSAAAFGAPEAQAAAQFASQVTSIAQIGLREELKLEAEEKRKKQIANTRSRVNLARAQDRDYMANLRAKKGKSGSTVYDQAQIDFEEKFKNRVSEIEDPKERVLFEQAYSPHMNHNLDIASNHQFRETEIYNKETKFSLIEQEYADASANKHDHNFVTDSANIVKMQTRELYQDMGKEIADRKVAEATSSFHATMVGAYSQDANGYISANKYYQDNKDEIDGTVQIQIEKDLSNMRLTEASQIKTDRIVVSTDDYTEQLEAARAIKDPELRDRTVERVKVRHNEDANKRRVAKQVQYEGAIDKILDVHQRGRSQEEALVIANKLEGQSRLDAIKVTKWTYASSEKKAKVVTDQAVVMQVKEGIDNGKVTTPNQIQTMLAGKATPGDNKSTVDYLAKGGNKQGLKDSKVRSMYKNLFQQKPDDEPEAYEYVWQYVEDNLEPGKLPTDSSVRKIMLEAQLQFVTEGETKDAFAFGRGRDKTFAEAVEAGRGDEWLPDVTGVEEKKIKSELRKLGRDLTESNIRAYKKHVTLKIPWSGNQYE